MPYYKIIPAIIISRVYDFRIMFFVELGRHWLDLAGCLSSQMNYEY